MGLHRGFVLFSAGKNGSLPFEPGLQACRKSLHSSICCATRFNRSSKKRPKSHLKRTCLRFKFKNSRFNTSWLILNGSFHFL